MRLWSLHPAHLDRQGLTACWREALLAQAVLAGRTRGYTRHPQLERFRTMPDPRGSVAAYLDAVQQEAATRGYRFDPARIDAVPRSPAPIEVSDAQLRHEWTHLLAKLAVRSPQWFAQQRDRRPMAHPLFRVVPGPVADWERAPATDPAAGRRPHPRPVLGTDAAPG